MGVREELLSDRMCQMMGKSRCYLEIELWGLEGYVCTRIYMDMCIQVVSTPPNL